jgi:flagellar motor switch protein FliN
MSDQLNLNAGSMCDALADELATVLGALLGLEAAATASLTPAEPDWLVPIALAGEATGELGVGLTRVDAARLAQLVMGTEEEPPETAVTDVLQEVCGQASGALAQRPLATGLGFRVGSARPFEGAEARGTMRSCQIALSDTFSPLIACWCDVVPARTGADASERDQASAGPTASADHAATAPDDREYPQNLEVILDIELPMMVRFGEAELTLDALTKLGPGSVIDFGRAPDDPVDVLVNGRLVARGEVVVVAGNYGVRVTEVVSTSDRLRSMARLRTRATDRF